MSVDRTEHLSRSAHRATLTAEQLAQSEANAASVRLHTSFSDPYEEWQKQTRLEAFHTARTVQSSTQNALRKAIDTTRTNMEKSYRDRQDQQLNKLSTLLEQMKFKKAQNEERLHSTWRERELKILDRIQKAIDHDEKKLKEKAAAEALVRRQRDLEEQRENAKVQEAKKKVEEDARKAEEDAKAQEEQKAALKKRALLDEEQKMQSQQTPGSASHVDWKTARSIRAKLKSGAMAQVKADSRSKSTWGAIRRQIRARVGQLINDPVVIERISTQLYTLLQPAPHAPAHSEPLYHALLSALAKAILAQAEIEVVAQPAAAHPLGIVTSKLLGSLPDFQEIFWARLVQRTGGWAIPCHLSETTRDWDGNSIGGDEICLRKVRGYGDSEGREEEEEYATRVAAIMRVYFEAISTPMSAKAKQYPPLEVLQMSRTWIWLSRCLNSGNDILGHQAAVQIMHAALAVTGRKAKQIWGKQFIKMLHLIYEGVKNGGGGGDKDKILGDTSPEANAARVRVQLEIEKILGT